jgi:hypothetical protein
MSQAKAVPTQTLAAIKLIRARWTPRGQLESLSARGLGLAARQKLANATRSATLPITTNRRGRRTSHEQAGPGQGRMHGSHRPAKHGA